MEIIQDKLSYSGKWIEFYFGWYFHLKYSVCGYFDNRPRISIGLLFFNFIIILPFYNKWKSESTPTDYGIAIHNNTFWIYTGGTPMGGTSWIAWDIPFFTMLWMRTSILLENDDWVHITRNDEIDIFSEEWAEMIRKQKEWLYYYTDSYDGKKIKATIKVEEREWRPKWLTWTRLFSKVRRTISVTFHEQVGSGKNTYKGGVTGCSYEMLPGESPISCIQRMEADKEFLR